MQHPQNLFLIPKVVTSTLKIKELEHLLLSIRHVRDCIFIYEHDYINTAQCLVSILSTSYLWSNFQYIKKSALSETQLLNWLIMKVQMVGSEQFQGLSYLL